MISSERAELRDIIDRSFVGKYGGRASFDMLAADVLAQTPDHVVRALAASSVRRRITDYLNERNDIGLPQAPVANVDGEHVQLDLMDPKELQFAAEACLQRRDKYAAQARKYGRIYQERYEMPLVVHGVNLSAEERAS